MRTRGGTKVTRWLEEVVGPILQIRTAQNLILEGTWQGLHFVCFFGGHTGGAQGFASWLCPGGFRAPYETQGLEPGSAPCRAHALPIYQVLSVLQDPEFASNAPTPISWTPMNAEGAGGHGATANPHPILDGD